jgi:HupE / UreJ protein
MIDNLLTFIQVGFRHILPLGLDHICFIVAIYLTARGWKSLLLQVSCFTLAHTITLGLAAAGVITVSADIVEPLIALSIAVVAVEAVFVEKAPTWRLPVIFGFGLFHGMGFASQMRGYMEGSDFTTALLGFNVGVELGQLAVLAGAALAALLVRSILKAARKPDLYRWVFVRPIAVAIATFGLVWMVQRLGWISGGDA